MIPSVIFSLGAMLPSRPSTRAGTTEATEAPAVAAAVGNRQQVLGVMVVMSRDEQVVLGVAVARQAKQAPQRPVGLWK